MATKKQIEAAREAWNKTFPLFTLNEIFEVIIDAAVPPLTSEERDAIERCMCRDPDVVVAFRYFERVGLVTDTSYYTNVSKKNE